jgi:hypothetical protein
MLKKALGDQADLDAAFAWRAFTYDPLTPDILSLKDKRPSIFILKSRFYLINKPFIQILQVQVEGQPRKLKKKVFIFSF